MKTRKKTSRQPAWCAKTWNQLLAFQLGQSANNCAKSETLEGGGVGTTGEGDGEALDGAGGGDRASGGGGAEVSPPAQLKGE